MTSTWKVTEAFGTEAQIERLKREAIGIAGATGSVGATSEETHWDQETNESSVAARVTVERVRDEVHVPRRMVVDGIL